VEVKKLRKQLEAKNYDEVYKENELLKKEVKSMYILLDENNDLREELERLRQMSYNDRVKESGEENQKLRRRNGELLI
jgi:cell shape-determining protein MreC